jgi:hypothetical protein
MTKKTAVAAGIATAAVTLISAAVLSTGAGAGSPHGRQRHELTGTWIVTVGAGAGLSPLCRSTRRAAMSSKTQVGPHDGPPPTAAGNA